ncbi:hypothetical protein [Parvularcula maris]|uniref:Uncharacterized protein n=1 Tax=Parvularcula maris TaxID=2965077 RepID=A0A9X2L9J7_9PROT|nr:hypothetical protein [Parvularcula maris]MCQ8185439.1 hypothetical protein [Parvularcula maris]
MTQNPRNQVSLTRKLGRLGSAKAWKIILQNVRESLGPSDAAILALSGLITAGADLVQPIPRVLWPLLFLGVVVFLYVAMELVSRPIQRNRRRVLSHVLLASTGIVFASGVIIALGGNSDESNIAQLLDQTSSISRDASDIAQSTRDIATNTEMLNTSIEEERLAMQIQFRIDRSASSENVFEGSIIWPPNYQVRKNSCEFTVGNDDGAFVRYEALNCERFRATVQPDVARQGMGGLSGLSSYPWLSAHLRDGRRLNIPTFNMATAMMGELTPLMTQMMTEQMTGGTVPGEVGIEVTRVRGDFVAQAMSDGEPVKDGRCQWYDMSMAVTTEPIGGDSCRVKLVVGQLLTGRALNRAELQLILSTGMTGHSQAKIPVPPEIFTQYAEQQERNFPDLDPFVSVSSMAIGEQSFDRTSLKYSLETAAELRGAYFKLTGLNAFILDRSSGHLSNASVTLGERGVHNSIDVIGGSELNGGFAARETPEAVAFCSAAQVGSDVRITISVWTIDGGGYAKGYERTLARSTQQSRYDTSTMDAECSTPGALPVTTLQLLEDAPSVSRDMTVVAFKQRLVQTCSNASASADNLLFCIRQASNAMFGGDFRPRLTSNGYVLLGCGTLHGLYVKAVTQLARQVAMPTVSTSPSCEVYGMAAEELRKDMEAFTEQHSNRKWTFIYEPYAQLAAVCRKGGEGRLDACDATFAQGQRFLRTWRERCSASSNSRTHEQYRSAVQQKRQSAERLFGNKPLQQGGHQDDAPLATGLEPAALEWYLGQIEAETCPTA